MGSRTCSRCGLTDVEKGCPRCTEEWEHRRDVAGMTVEDRVAEFDSWGPILEIDFSKFHQRMEELVGRPVWTHEFAKPEFLRHEILTETHPTLDGVLAKLPHDKPVIVVKDESDE